MPPGSYALTVTDRQGCSGIQNILVKYLSDTENPLQQAVLMIYPNPAQDVATLSVTGPKVMALELLDALGRTLQTYELNEPMDMSVWQVSLAELPAGTYLARLLGKNQQTVATGRLVHIAK